MPNTYVALATQTLGTAASSVTFSSISQGYTDLVLVVGNTLTSVNGYGFTFGVNGDTGTNYSGTILGGNGSSAGSARYTSISNTSTYFTGYYSGLSTTDPGVSTLHFQNYSNTTTNKTILARGNSASKSTEASVWLWRSTAAINQITIYSQSGSNMAAGVTFSLYGIANADQGAAKATGGIITEDSQYWYHTFAASGAFTPKVALTADILVVAGGGSGGGGRAGGGGAGGLLVHTSQALTAINYNCTIGGGAAINSGNVNGNQGTNSQFGSLTASVGGGFGASAFISVNGGNGGSGGGAPAAYTGGTNTTGQGFAGGNGAATSNDYRGTGGGGGAGAAGQVGFDNSTPGGAGGAGLSSAIINAMGAATGAGQLSGGNYYFAGGGGGGTFYAGTAVGGLGGGGTANTSAGVANTGGGGGGASQNGGSGLAFAGGSGIVIVRYAK